MAVPLRTKRGCSWGGNRRVDRSTRETDKKDASGRAIRERKGAKSPWNTKSPCSVEHGQVGELWARERCVKGTLGDSGGNEEHRIGSGRVASGEQPPLTARAEGWSKGRRSASLPAHCNASRLPEQSWAPSFKLLASSTAAVPMCPLAGCPPGVPKLAPCMFFQCPRLVHRPPTRPTAPKRREPAGGGL